MQLHSSTQIKTRNPNNIAGGHGLPADNLWRGKKRSKFETKQVLISEFGDFIKGVTVTQVGWRADGKVVGKVTRNGVTTDVVKVDSMPGVKKSKSVGVWRKVA